jgi:hypothetical protein
MRRLWVALLLGLLVVATVVGVALAGSKSAPVPQPLQAISRSMTVPASSCYPKEDGELWWNNGAVLGGETDAPRQWFICPVNFPDFASVHVVQSITLYCYDQHTWSGDQYDVIANVYRTEPSLGAETQMGTVRSTGWSTDDPKAWTISGTQISPKQVYPRQAMYFWVSFAGHPNLLLYGFKINYTIPS